ncbi:HDOD domain-containing protein [bacterium]|nr:HDOD domain-containing protein [bacterium]
MLSEGNEFNGNSRKIFVSSCDFVVQATSDVVLEAILGTCVGVAIVDEEAQVGGLFHILLPRPTGNTPTWTPRTYASTGLPEFLKELLKAGATVENMKATIAGGALVGPISVGDLQLDIGGRTASIVSDFLKEQDIHILQSETGGYFSCKLMLSLKSFATKIEPVGIYTSREMQSFAKIQPDEVDRVISQVRPIPQIALKIIRMINSDEYDMTEISKEVKQDQVISAKVLNLANSAMIGARRKIESINQALVMLGEKKLLMLAISSSMEMYYMDLPQGYSLSKGGLYNHSLTTAIVASHIAEYSDAVKSDVAYTAGLLHDIGKVVLDNFVAKYYPLFYRRVYEDELTLEEVEKKILGMSHTEAGKRLAELWALPDSITEAIALHLRPEEAELNPALTHTVYLADLLLSRFHTAVDLERISSEKLEERLDVVGIPAEEFPHLIDSIPWHNFDLEANV